jgi:hypothetical protein
MNRTRIAPAVGLGLAALLALAPAANAEPQNGPRPNLALAKISKPPAATAAGSKLKVVVKVKNKGAAKAGKSKLAVYLAQGKKHGKKDQRLKRVKVKPLAPGKTAKKKLTVLIPASTQPGSYRLIACADDRRKLKESKERDNCRATRKLQVPPPPAPAFSTTDQIEWSFSEEREFKHVEAGSPITATLRAANGLPGQAGYSRTDVAPVPFAGGTTTTFDYSANTNSEDDGEVTVPLPFAFPVGGVSEQSVSVSTNGWIGFGSSPAYDFWNDVQNSDYRGIPNAVGELERGIMPYWGDLNLENVKSAGTGTVKEVVAADNSFVAFQWDIGQFTLGQPRRTFEVVLFPNGSFRFDYPGENAAGGNKAFIGYSLGSGPASITTVAADTESVPAGSILFTPNPVTAGAQLAAGQATLTLPPDSSLISAEPGCGLTQAPTETGGGLVTCAAPALAVGQQTAWTVRFAVPPDAPGEPAPANFRYKGEYLSGSVALSDADEVDPLTTDLRATSIEVRAAWAGALTLHVGEVAPFNVEVDANNGGLDEPAVTFALPANTTLNSIVNSGDPIPCGAISGGQITCKLASGTNLSHLTVTVTPSAAAQGQSLVLGATASALNAPPASKTAESPTVVP